MFKSKLVTKRPRLGSYCAEVFLLSCMIGFACSHLSKEKYIVATLDAGQKRSIVIWADSIYDNGRSFYYEVRKGDQVVVPPYFICARTAQSDIKVQAIIGRDRNLFGATSEDRPQTVLLIHDFGSGETWPGVLSSSESPSQTHERGLGLLKKLENEYPERKFVLRESSCN